MLTGEKEADSLKQVLRYPGFIGKSGSEDLQSLLKEIPMDFDRYVEPFFGDGAIYFSLKPKRARLRITEKAATVFYEALAENYGRLRSELDELEGKVWTKQEFEACLEALNDSFCQDRKENGWLPGMLAYAYFHYQQWPQNGVIRKAYGDYDGIQRNGAPFQTKGVTEAHSILLRTAERVCGEDMRWQDFLNGRQPNDFVVIDPPKNFGYHWKLMGKRQVLESPLPWVKLMQAFVTLPCRGMLIYKRTGLTMSLFNIEFLKRFGNFRELKRIIRYPGTEWGHGVILKE